MRLQSVLNLVDDIGDQTNDLTDKSGEQNGQEHDKHHTDDGTENGDHVLTHGVVVGNHGAEEDQQTQPDEGEGADEADNIDLGGDAEVGVDGSGNDQEGQRKQAVAGCHEDVLEATLTLEQGGQTPVSHLVPVASAAPAYTDKDR